MQQKMYLFMPADQWRICLLEQMNKAMLHMLQRMHFVSVQTNGTANDDQSIVNDIDVKIANNKFDFIMLWCIQWNDLSLLKSLNVEPISALGPCSQF